jgi:hypothetical protein
MCGIITITPVLQKSKAMSNMFKSERKPMQNQGGDRVRRNNRNLSENNGVYKNEFSGLKDKKRVEIKLTEADFPELLLIKPENNSENECKLNFKDAYLKDAVEDVKDDIPPFGWTRYRVKDGQLIVDGESLKKEDEDYTAEEYHYDAVQIFNCLINKWENYKEYYNELHGDDEYERLYKMPNYESFLDCEE